MRNTRGTSAQKHQKKVKNETPQKDKKLKHLTKMKNENTRKK